MLITAGPTREQIDPVRFISNNSSGKMGYALAQAALDMGANVTLISGPVSLDPPAGVKLVCIKTTQELYKTVIRLFPKSDSLIMAAAPADYTPVKKASQKIKKSDAKASLDLTLTVDILREISSLKKTNQKVIGFALETENGLANAKKKLKEKNLDMIVLNQPGSETAFESDTNEVTIIRPRSKPLVIKLAEKSKISARLLDLISDMF